MLRNDDCLVVLPARMQSSRLPDKMLADIHGAPLVVRTAQNVQRMIERCSQQVEMVVATDHNRILEVCLEYGIPAVLTSGDCRTGTDRVYDAVNRLGKTVSRIVNVQADEPLMHRDCLRIMLEDSFKPGWPGCSCGAAEISGEEAQKASIGTVAVDCDSNALYITRAAIPARKDGGMAPTYLTQVCIYCFSPAALQRFGELTPGPCETIEDIELLRLIEHGDKVSMVGVPGERLAVDTPEDLEKVRSIYLSRQ